MSEIGEYGHPFMGDEDGYCTVCTKPKDTNPEHEAALISAKVREALRFMAVAQVDQEHGYTVEFSASPEAHRDEYDDREQALLAQAERWVAAGKCPECGDREYHDSGPFWWPCSTCQVVLSGGSPHGRD